MGAAPISTAQGEIEARASDSIRAVDSARLVAEVLGWSVFPCHGIVRGRCTCSKGADCSSPGKHPRTSNGVKDATTAVPLIEAWAERWPDANWAATPGDLGVVIDIDPRKNGFDSIAEWALESSWVVNTGGAGRHYYFTTDEPVSNRNNWLPGVDVKAAGGYVILPGSEHISGGSYVWAFEPPEVEPPRAPRDLLDSIRQGPTGGSTNVGRFDLADAIAGLPEGQRDDGLFRAACVLRNRFNDDRGLVETVVLALAARCSPPFPHAQAMRKVEQAFAQERQELPPELIAWATGIGQVQRRSILEAMRAALLTPEDLENLPDPEWLIEGILTTSSMSVLYGSPGLGKTFLGLDWALRIGVGLQWFDRAVKHGAVLYVYAEGVHGLKQRRAAWVQHTGLLGSDVRFFPRAVPLLDDDWVQALADLTAELLPVLVVIDTLARSTAGADENSVKDMSRAVAACDAVREASGSAVMLVHHTGKDGSNYRGSSAIEGAADTMLHLARKDDGSIELRCTKQKDAEEFDAIPLDLRSVGPSAVLVEGTSVQPFIDQATGGQLLSVLNADPEMWLATAVIAEQGGVKVKKTAQRRLDQMWEGGLIDRRDTGKGYQYRAKPAPA